MCTGTDIQVSGPGWALPMAKKGQQRAVFFLLFLKIKHNEVITEKNMKRNEKEESINFLKKI